MKTDKRACERIRQWQIDNRERYLASKRKWARKKAKDPVYSEKRREDHRRFERKHKKRRAVEKKAFRLRTRFEMIALMGGKCVKCGFSDHRALQVDHINASDTKWIDNKLGGYVFYRQLLRGEYDLSEFQLLCANCNWIKRWELNETHGVRKNRGKTSN